NEKTKTLDIGQAHRKPTTPGVTMRRSLITSFALAAVALGATSAVADAHTAGYATMQQCSGLNGTITYTPGLGKKPQVMQETIVVPPSGCTGSYATAQAGTGTFSATLTAPAANVAANNASGTFVINWPAASGLNPTTGVLSIAGPNAAQYVLNGS